MNSATLVQKLWNYCNVLRDDGMSHGDYPSASLRGEKGAVVELCCAVSLPS